MSGAVIYIKEDLKISDVQIEILVGTINIYSLVGAAIAGRTSDWIGRRYTIILASLIFFVGAILMGFAPNYWFLMFGRFVAGIGVGYALMIAPVYTAEVAPASCRGFFTSFPEVFINGDSKPHAPTSFLLLLAPPSPSSVLLHNKGKNIGVLLGYISNYAFSKLPTKLGWRFMLGIGVIPSVLLGIGVLAMPESPRWLVMQGRLGDAKKVLDRTSDTLEESKTRLADIKEAAGIPQDCQDDIVSVTRESSHGSGVWRELFLHPTPTVLHILIAAIGIHFFQQASGIDAVVLYSPRIYEKAGITKPSYRLLATIAVGCMKTFFTLVATFLVDKIGRRILLLSSCGGMILSLLALATGLTIIDHSDHTLKWAIVVCVCATYSTVAFFSIGMGPLAWVYSSEIFPLRLRAQGCSIGVAVNRAVSGGILMTFISLYKAISIGGAFFLYAGVASVAWIFFYTLLPETKGRTLEEMEPLFGTFFKWRSTMKELKKNRVEGDDMLSSHNFKLVSSNHVNP
uniref:Mannitol transporter n=1 Tax=Solanum tuberosum TaxID=4113 RepID=M1AVD1_SOLTU